MPPGISLSTGHLVGRTKSEQAALEAQTQPQPSVGAIGNIVFPSSRNKGQLIIPPFTEDEFTRIPAVAQW